MVVFFVALPVLAQKPTSDLGINALAEGGVALGRSSLPVIVGRIVQAALGLVGVVFVVLIVYGGYMWMMSAGDSTQIGKAKKTIINAVIGIAIILSALAISQFIISKLTEATTGTLFGAGDDGYSQPLSASLGAGIIGGHVPERGATAPRNTKIAINFKEAVDEKTIIVDTNGNDIYGDDGDLADTGTFKMTKTAILKQAGGNWKNVPSGELVIATGKFTPDKLNFVFAPTALLGNPTETVSYTVYITSDLKKVDGTAAFSDSFSSGYVWEFQVEPKIDTIPPKLESIVPSKGVNPRNTIVQMNFNEPVDPTSASGITQTGGTGFQNIILRAGATILAGSYKISNGYKTVEFVTNDVCGMNSCGGEIYCLPGNSLITGLIKAATLGVEPPQAAGFPYDGVVDMASNSFDGNGDGKGDGPKSVYQWIGGDPATGDNVGWTFNTSDQIDLVPPKILKINPGIDAQNVGLDQPVEMTFSKVMSSYTINNTNLSIMHNVPAPFELWYSAGTAGLDINDNPVVPGAEPVRTKAIVTHGSFMPSQAGGAQYRFYPSSNAKVQDLRQNCFNPAVGPSCTPTIAEPYCCNGVLSATKCAYVP